MLNRLRWLLSCEIVGIPTKPLGKMAAIVDRHFRAHLQARQPAVGWTSAHPKFGGYATTHLLLSYSFPNHSQITSCLNSVDHLPQLVRLALSRGIDFHRANTTALEFLRHSLR